MSKERTYKWDVTVPFVAMIILLINGIARKNWISELKEFKILPHPLAHLRCTSRCLVEQRCLFFVSGKAQGVGHPLPNGGANRGCMVKHGIL